MNNNYKIPKRLIIIPALLTMLLIAGISYWWAGDGRVNAAQPGHLITAQENHLIDPLLIISNSSTGLTEMLITDSTGRRTGYDPSSHTVLREIPAASYDEDGGVEDIETGKAGIPSFMQLYLHGANSGFYRLTVFGTDTGSYNIEIHSQDSSGQSFVVFLDNTTYPGKVDEYLISYSSTFAKDLTAAPGRAFLDESSQGTGKNHTTPTGAAEDPTDDTTAPLPDDLIQDAYETSTSPAISADDTDDTPQPGIWATIKRIIGSMLNTLRRWIRIP